MADYTELDIRRIVGGGAFHRGEIYAKAGHVGDLVDGGDVLTGRVSGGRPTPYRVSVQMSPAPHGLRRPSEGYCTCPVTYNCKHVAAVLLAARSCGPAARPALWRGHLDALIGADEAGRSGTERVQAELGLQFELRPPAYSGARFSTGDPDVVRLGVRPVLRGKRDRWIRTGISWSDLDYRAPLAPREQVNVLRTLSALANPASARYYGQAEAWLHLETCESPLLWELLAEAQRAGLPLVEAGPKGTAVTLMAEPATASLDVRTDAGGLRLEPSVLVGERPLDLACLAFIGSEPHGLYAWDQGIGPAAGLILARLAAPLPASWREILNTGEIEVPAEDVGDFTTNYFPRLRRDMPLTSQDASFEFPELPRPTLRLRLTHHESTQLDFEWTWVYSSPTAEGGQASGRELPLWSPQGDTRYRDLGAEAEILDALPMPYDLYPALADGRLAQRPAERATLRGLVAISFLTTEMDDLYAVPGLEIVEVGEPPEYRAGEGAPEISISTSAADGDRDWFDLSVSVTIDGEDVPFNLLFTALARDEEILVLPSGTYFHLDRPELRQLRDLIVEARALQDSPGAGLKISRFQAGLWDELVNLGVVAEQADRWQKIVAALAADGPASHTETEPPAGLQATLRPYQQAGYAWLAALYDNGLGGILADDMGLGKTVQALALIAHARAADAARAAEPTSSSPEAGADTAPEGTPPSGPFLVVAPTSVVGNWVAEAGKFTPHLRAVAIAETGGKRGDTLAELTAGADIVVTSYTLFRLEYEEYAALPWAGLLLDEAQMIKNHQSKGYQCARRLPAPFKLAISGTPMENNLTELWALFGLTAPGLLGHETQFSEYYRTPIERDRDTARLAQLKRRISPLMLRRTKEEVAVDLPPKQEQVIEVQLNPRHRAVYQRHLQRERQKVLGLIEDMNANRFAIFRSLTLLRQLALDPSLVDESHAGISATKLDVLFDLLDDVVAEGHRVLVFSQFTGFLGRVRDRLDTRGIAHCYLDGRTRKRAQVIETFREGDAPVFLISLKAGGVGLNLTEADYCILLDPWWNPAAEAQAVDRAHRIGQTRQVMVYRLVAAETIEEKVMALKGAKAELFANVMSGEEMGDSRLTAADIRELLS